ncbi:uncharacterized protein ACBR49_005624 [Aulostomus maculatus]
MLELGHTVVQWFALSPYSKKVIPGSSMDLSVLKMLCNLIVVISFFSVGTPDTGCNVSNILQDPLLQAVTSQSSNYTPNRMPYHSLRAIDGDKEKCAHTDLLANSWWTIDLRGFYEIFYLEIFNVDQSNIEMEGTSIHIGNSREKNGTTNEICVNITHFHPATHNNFSCPSSLSGRYVTVFSPPQRNLILCEIKIYGFRKDSPFTLINETKTWRDALYHCRSINRELASILSDGNQTLAELEASKADTEYVWLGLHYTCTLGFWFWLIDETLHYKRWAQQEIPQECNTSGAMEKQENHTWFSKSDNNTFNFICMK